MKRMEMTTTLSSKNYPDDSLRSPVTLPTFGAPTPPTSSNSDVSSPPLRKNSSSFRYGVDNCHDDDYSMQFEGVFDHIKTTKGGDRTSSSRRHVSKNHSSFPAPEGKTPKSSKSRKKKMSDSTLVVGPPFKSESEDNETMFSMFKWSVETGGEGGMHVTVARRGSASGAFSNSGSSGLLELDDSLTESTLRKRRTQSVGNLVDLSKFEAKQLLLSLDHHHDSKESFTSAVTLKRRGSLGMTTRPEVTTEMDKPLSPASAAKGKIRKSRKTNALDDDIKGKRRSSRRSEEKARSRNNSLTPPSSGRRRVSKLEDIAKHDSTASTPDAVEHDESQACQLDEFLTVGDPDTLKTLIEKSRKKKSSSSHGDDYDKSPKSKASTRASSSKDDTQSRSSRRSSKSRGKHSHSRSSSKHRRSKETEHESRSTSKEGRRKRSSSKHRSDHRSRHEKEERAGSGRSSRTKEEFHLEPDDSAMGPGDFITPRAGPKTVLREEHVLPGMDDVESGETTDLPKTPGPSSQGDVNSVLATPHSGGTSCPESNCDYATSYYTSDEEDSDDNSLDGSDRSAYILQFEPSQDGHVNHVRTDRRNGSWIRIEHSDGTHTDGLIVEMPVTEPPPSDDVLSDGEGGPSESLAVGEIASHGDKKRFPKMASRSKSVRNLLKGTTKFFRRSKVGERDPVSEQDSSIHEASLPDGPDNAAVDHDTHEPCDAEDDGSASSTPLESLPSATTAHPRRTESLQQMTSASRNSSRHLIDESGEAEPGGEKESDVTDVLGMRSAFVKMKSSSTRFRRRISL